MNDDLAVRKFSRGSDRKCRTAAAAANEMGVVVGGGGGKHY